MKMYDYFSGIISKELKKDLKYITQINTEKIYLYLLYIKYLGTLKEEKKTLKMLFDNDDLKELYKYLNKNYGFSLYLMKNVNLKMLLKLMKDYNYKDLLMEYLSLKENVDIEILGIFKNPKDKVLYLNDSENIHNYLNNIPSHDYVAETIDGRKKPSLILFNLVDQMLGIKSQSYDTLKEVDLDKYDLVIINDTSPSYIFSSSSDDNLIRSINRYFYLENNYQGKIILKTNFNKISKFPYPGLIKERLSKVMLHKDVTNLMVYMEFNCDNNDSISLILINDEKYNFDELKSLITNNRSKKNCLLKIKPDQMIENNYRISFKMYEEKNIEKVKAMNDIVDENSILTERLENLNEEIFVEVAHLLERKGG